MQKISTLTFSGIFVMLTFAFGGFSLQAQTAAPNQSTKQEDKPTVITRGQVTDKQRGYTQAYKKYLNPEATISKQLELAKQHGYKGDFSRLRIVETNQQFSQFPIPNFFCFLNLMSDAIVFGSAQSKFSSLTADESMIYTEYDFLVKEVFKSTPSMHLEKNKTIQITRPGGAVKIDNHIFRFNTLDFGHIQKGKDYLLFLRYIPEADSYISDNFYGAFVLNDNRFTPVSRIFMPTAISQTNDLSNFSIYIRDAIKSDCKTLLKFP